MSKQLVGAAKSLADFCAILTQKLEDPNKQIDLSINTISEKLTRFFDAGNQEIRVRYIYWIHREIRVFLKKFVLPRLKSLKAKMNDPIQFIQEIGQIWQNYQRFVYVVKFINNRADNTLKDFHKVAVKFQNFLTDQAKKDNTDPLFKNQLAPVPVIAGNQLKQFLTIQNLLGELTKKFVDHFCNFIRQERDGLNVPREKVNEVLQFFESMSLDYDCECARVNGRLKIVKAVAEKAPANRKSTANRYFDDTFIPQIMDDCGLYYRTWIDTKGILATPSQQIKQMLKFISQEQDRAKYYIHDPKNEAKYIQTLQRNLIEYKFNQRVQKQSGLKSFLANYESNKAQMTDQISNFWKVYKRVYKIVERQKVILKIYQNYLIEESVSISRFVDKPLQFIQKSILLNKNNVQILHQIMNKPLQLDRIRVQTIQALLSMKHIDNKHSGKIKEHFGARHWAGYLNKKFVAKYNKGQPFGPEQYDLAVIFKLLVQKTVALIQYTKFLCARLLQEVDMSMVNQYSNALDLQTRMLEEIKKSTSQTDIKGIQNCIKDMKSSFDERTKLKQFKKMPSYGFFNQVIRKTGTHWTDSFAFEIQPPVMVRPCIQTMRQYYTDKNFVFEFQNGTSLFTGQFKQPLRFQLKNIYMMILLLIDEQKSKRMFYTDIIKAIKPLGQSEKAKNQLIKCLLQLNVFGIIKTNKQLGPNTNPAEFWEWSASDYFEINVGFMPAKMVPCIKNNHLNAVPDYIKKAIQQKMVGNEDDKRLEQVRRHVVACKCVQLLKHAQAMEGGKGTITFDQLVNGQKRQSNVTPTYLKQIMEYLINQGLCERVEDKRNVFRYIS